MLEPKLLDENKIKTAAIILNKVSHSNIISTSKQTNILQIDDEPQGVEVTSFLYNLPHDSSNYSEILSKLDISADLVYNTHAKKFWISFVLKMKRKPYQNNLIWSKRKTQCQESIKLKRKKAEEACRKKLGFPMTMCETWQILFKRSCAIWKRKRFQNLSKLSMTKVKTYL